MTEMSELVNVPIFSGIEREAVEEFSRHGKTLSFGSGDRLFARDESANELMILLDGVVELLFPMDILGVSRELILESRHAGDVLAWSALVGPYHFTLSARCSSPCTLVSFNRETLRDYFESNPLIGYRFMENLSGVIAQRLHSLQMIWLHDLQSGAISRLES
jgi:CRP/FNR family cyclic AMP-dependent transcriptional regulator